MRRPEARNLAGVLSSNVPENRLRLCVWIPVRVYLAFHKRAGLCILALSSNVERAMRKIAPSFATLAVLAMLAFSFLHWFEFRRESEISEHDSETPTLDLSSAVVRMEGLDAFGRPTYCTGVFIAKKKVLTAAECAYTTYCGDDECSYTEAGIANWKLKNEKGESWLGDQAYPYGNDGIIAPLYKPLKNPHITAGPELMESLKSDNWAVLNVGTPEAIYQGHWKFAQELPFNEPMLMGFFDREHGLRLLVCQVMAVYPRKLELVCNATEWVRLDDYDLEPVPNRERALFIGLMGAPVFTHVSDGPVIAGVFIRSFDACSYDEWEEDAPCEDYMGALVERAPTLDTLQVVDEDWRNFGKN